MAAITIRQLDEAIKARLRIRAAHHGRSMEEEAREILRSALTNEAAQQVHPVESILRQIKEIGGVDLPIPRRGPIRERLEFGK